MADRTELQKQPRADLSEIGVTGLKVQSGRIMEEQLRQLKGDRAPKTYEEMRLNEPIIHAALLSYELWVREADWRVDPADETPRAAEIRDFVDGAFDDMSHTWQDHVTEALSFLQFGWSFFEIVYARRQGRRGDHASSFDDGLIGWRKFAPRAQTTRDRWQFDDEGGLEAFVQRAPDFSQHIIPIDKGLLYRATKRRGNPEPHPPLRAAFVPWWLRKRFREIEAIGIERDLAGFPVMYVDPEVLQDNNRRDEYKQIVRDIKRDEQEGVLLPASFDEHGNRRVELVLLSTGGKRQFDIGKVQGRLALEIMLALVADILLIGHENVGSFSLAETKMSLVETAGETWLAEIADVMNHHAIPRLLELNGMPTELAPTLVPGELRSRDLTERATAIMHFANTAMLTPDDETENVLRDELGLPEREVTDSGDAAKALPADQSAMFADLLAGEAHPNGT